MPAPATSASSFADFGAIGSHRCHTNLLDLHLGRVGRVVIVDAELDLVIDRVVIDRDPSRLHLLQRHECVERLARLHAVKLGSAEAVAQHVDH